MRENYTIKEVSEMFNITRNKIRFYNLKDNWEYKWNFNKKKYGY